jgi:hypothetical protein
MRSWTRLAILKSLLMLPAYLFYVTFMKMLILCNMRTKILCHRNERKNTSIVPFVKSSFG